MSELVEQQRQLQDFISSKEQEPETDEEKEIYARVKQFQIRKHRHLLEIDRIEGDLARLLERKAMTTEEIRSRLMMRADMVSQLEEYEYQLESAADDL